jgi:hypothetical protein
MKNLPTMRQLLFLLPFLFLTIVFCKKEDVKDDTPTSFSPDVLTAGVWVIKQDFVDQNANGTLVDILEDCSRDDTWSFKTTGSYIYTEAGELCEPDLGTYQLTGKWEMQNNNTTLHIELGEDVIIDEDDYQIITLNDTLLVLHVLKPNTTQVIEKVVLKK